MKILANRVLDYLIRVTRHGGVGTNAFGGNFMKNDCFDVASHGRRNAVLTRRMLSSSVAVIALAVSGYLSPVRANEDCGNVVPDISGSATVTCGNALDPGKGPDVVYNDANNSPSSSTAFDFINTQVTGGVGSGSNRSGVRISTNEVNHYFTFNIDQQGAGAAPVIYGTSFNDIGNVTSNGFQVRTSNDGSWIVFNVNQVDNLGVHGSGATFGGGKITANADGSGARALANGIVLETKGAGASVTATLDNMLIYGGNATAKATDGFNPPHATAIANGLDIETHGDDAPVVVTQGSGIISGTLVAAYSDAGISNTSPSSKATAIGLNVETSGTNAAVTITQNNDGEINGGKATATATSSSGSPSSKAWAIGLNVETSGTNAAVTITQNNDGEVNGGDATATATTSSGSPSSKAWANGLNVETSGGDASVSFTQNNGIINGGTATANAVAVSQATNPSSKA